MQGIVQGDKSELLAQKIAQKMTEMRQLQAEMEILQGSEAAALEASDREES